TGQFSEQKRGKRTVFVLEPREQPGGAREQARPRNPKDAVRPRLATAERVPARKVMGPMNVYYYDYLADRASRDDLRVVERISAKPQGDVLLYEMLNLVDGKRSVQAIRDYITAAYTPVSADEVYEYLKLLEKVGVIQF
ncbi:MAG TPA: hypothetical protein VJQ56_06215, partial [Blastocatellia bacterium]|nr:hypothetical protein [Blastocatellia bacterium]